MQHSQPVSARRRVSHAVCEMPQTDPERAFSHPPHPWRMFAFRASKWQNGNEQVENMRILGIDPGLRRLGWGVVGVDGSRMSHVAHGTCLSGDGPLAERLCRLHAGLSRVVTDFAPTHAAVEQTFVNRDPAGTLKLGQARGIALLVPAQAGLAVGEYAPNAVKKAIVGVGHAAKEQVGHMIALHFPGVRIAGPDAADALAVALTHAYHLRSSGRLAAALGRAAR